MSANDQDEQAAWAEICAEFDTIRIEANRIGLRPQWQELARATVTGVGSLAGWQQLVGEICRANGVDDDFTGRNGDSSELARNLRRLLGDSTDEYTCPRGLCNRRAASGGPPPRCDLLDAHMRVG